MGIDCLCYNDSSSKNFSKIIDFRIFFWYYYCIDSRGIKGENMSFEWFFKMPGLFITGGVVLILIALLVFLLGSKKEANKEGNLVEPKNDGGESNNVPVEPVAPIPVEPVSAPVSVEPVAPVAVEPVAPVTVEPVVAPVAPTPVEPVITPVAPINIEPAVPVTPVGVTPVAPITIEPVVPVTPVGVEPVIAPVPPVTVNTVASAPVEPVAQVDTIMPNEGAQNPGGPEEI